VASLCWAWMRGSGLAALLKIDRAAGFGEEGEGAEGFALGDVGDTGLSPMGDEAFEWSDKGGGGGGGVWIVGLRAVLVLVVRFKPLTVLKVVGASCM